MFTGLVEDVGTVVALTRQGGGFRVVVGTGFEEAGVDAGDSVAVDGICLTATRALQGGRFVATVGRETVARTTLERWRPGRRVNLERALRLSDRLGGHLVQGHVDGPGTVVELERQAESRVLWLDIPSDLLRYVAPKGSIAVDGVSLTVNEVHGPRIRVNVVPHSWSHTRFPDLRVGEAVNIEVDLLARYLERLLTGGAASSTAAGATGGDADPDSLLQKLRTHGFA